MYLIVLFSLFFSFNALSLSLHTENNQTLLKGSSCAELEVEAQKLKQFYLTRNISLASAGKNRNCSMQENSFQLDISNLTTPKLLKHNSIESSYNGPNCFNTVASLLGYNKYNRFVSGNELKFWLEQDQFCTAVTKPEPGDVEVFMENNKYVHAQFYISDTLRMAKDSFISSDTMGLSNRDVENELYSRSSKKFYRCENITEVIEKSKAANQNNIDCLIHASLYGENQVFDENLFNLIGDTTQSLRKIAQFNLQKKPGDKDALMEMARLDSLDVQLKFYLYSSPEKINVKNISQKKMKALAMSEQTIQKIPNSNWDELDDAKKREVLNNLLNLIKNNGSSLYDHSKLIKFTKLLNDITNENSEVTREFFESLDTSEKRTLLSLPTNYHYKGEKHASLAGAFLDQVQPMIEIDPREDLTASLDFFYDGKVNESEEIYSLKIIAEDILLRDGELLKAYIEDLSSSDRKKLLNSKLTENVLSYIDDPFDHKHLLSNKDYPFTNKKKLKQYLEKYVDKMIIDGN